MGVGPIGRIWATLGIDATTFESGLNKAQKGLKRAGRQMNRYGQQMTRGITLPLAGAAAICLKLSVDFNKAMANVSTLIPGSTERVKELKKSVQDLSIQTGKSTQDMADGLYQVISAFGDTGDTVKVLELNAKAAAAGLATVKEAIDLTSAVTKGYGDTSAAAVQKVSDLAFVTVKLGQTTFPELAASIGKVTPLAKELGLRMEEMFAAFAAGTGVTGKAPEVATQIRGILKSFMAPTKDMEKLLKGLGYQSGAAAIKALGFGGAVNKVAEIAKASGTPLQKFMGEVEAQTLALALAGPLADDYKKKLEAMGTASGATAQAFDEQTKGINRAGFALEQLKQKLAVTAQNLGDALGPGLSAALDGLEPAVDGLRVMSAAFAALDPAVQKVAATIAATFAAGGPILLALSKFSKGWALLFSPWGLIVVAITGAAATVGGVIWGLVQVFSETFNELRNIGEIFSTVWKNLCEGLGDLWERAWGRIANFLGVKLEVIQKKIQAAKDFIVSTFSDMATELVFQSVIPDMVSAITAQFQKLDQATRGITLGNTQYIVQSWTTAIDRLKAKFGQTMGITGQGQFGTGLPSLPQITAIPGQNAEFSQTIANLKGPISSAVSQGITGALQGKQAEISQIGWGLAESFINRTVDWGTGKLLDLFGKAGASLIDAGLQTGTDILTGCASGAGSLIEAGSSLVSMISNVFSGIGDLFGGGGGIFGSILGGIGSIFGFHQGGMIGRHGPIFAHGGWPSLAYDEVPIIGQTGERILSRAQNRNYESGGGGGGITVHAPITFAPVYNYRPTQSDMNRDAKMLVKAINKEISPRGQGIGSGRY